MNHIINIHDKLETVFQLNHINLHDKVFQKHLIIRVRNKYFCSIRVNILNKHNNITPCIPDGPHHQQLRCGDAPNAASAQGVLRGSGEPGQGAGRWHGTAAQDGRQQNSQGGQTGQAASGISRRVSTVYLMLCVFPVVFSLSVCLCFSFCLSSCLCFSFTQRGQTGEGCIRNLKESQ